MIPGLKTPEELDRLKKNWIEDPNWDIETTEGFELYKDELLGFRMKQEQKWEAEKITKRDAEDKKSRELGSKVDGLFFGDSIPFCGNSWLTKVMGGYIIEYWEAVGFGESATHRVTAAVFVPRR